MQADARHALKGVKVVTLDRKYKLVEVHCWRDAYNHGSVLFVLESAAPAKAKLIRFQYWGDNKLTQAYSLALPEYFRETRKLRSFHKRSEQGDCGVVAEWAWRAPDFRLTGVWVKDPCDGEPFQDEGDGPEMWQVYPPKR